MLLGPISLCDCKFEKNNSHVIFFNAINIIEVYRKNVLLLTVLLLVRKRKSIA